MNVLVVNCGSSSVKVDVVSVAGDERVARVLKDSESAGSATDALARVLDRVGGALASRGQSIDAVGHRVVHGGARFTQPTAIDAAALDALEALETLAPLHNRPAVEGIRACLDRFGHAVPMVAIFDTAFHASLPEHAWRYALPVELADRHGIRRYGFHGTSCRSVIERWAEISTTPVHRANAVVLHLGNGCSATAVQGGRSVDTSMGFTPLEGLVMGTRAGDLDPAIVGHLATVESMTVDEVETVLNERSGLLGLSGRSSDVRDLLAASAHNAPARLALEIFCYRARKYVGAYFAALGGAETLLFTGGIGEHAPDIRARVCAGLEWCGLRIDAGRNAGAVGAEACISVEGSRPAVMVIPSDEARVIARETAQCVRSAPGHRGGMRENVA
jgi:acetate kinase